MIKFVFWLAILELLTRSLPTLHFFLVQNYQFLISENGIVLAKEYSPERARSYLAGIISSIM